MEPAARREPDQFALEIGYRANFGVSHQIEQWPVDETHNDARVDAAYVRHDAGSNGRCVLYVAAKKHLDIERRGHENHFDVESLALEETLFFGDRDWHHGYSQRWDPDLYVFGMRQRG